MLGPRGRKQVAIKCPRAEGTGPLHDGLELEGREQGHFQASALNDSGVVGTGMRMPGYLGLDERRLGDKACPYKALNS